MAYELLLAQTLASTMGNTILRYNITIGLYLASLGSGAMYYYRTPSKSADNRLVNLEIALTFFGAFSPIAVMGVEALTRWYAHSIGVSTLNFWVTSFLSLHHHSWIILIGFLSGIELPLLMDLGKERAESGNEHVLIFDYVGTLLAAIGFPLVLLPWLGIIGVASTVAMGNVLIALLWLSTSPSIQRKKIKLGLILCFLTVFLSGLFHLQAVHFFFVEKLYFLQ